jgi:hypothetical protein
MVASFDVQTADGADAIFGRLASGWMGGALWASVFRALVKGHRSVVSTSRAQAVRVSNPRSMFLYLSRPGQCPIYGSGFDEYKYGAP